jgi:LmbE family N-acetylglucosaminyl deacetylase
VASRGEAASSGTPDQREQEARAAAHLVGAAIDFCDHFLNRGGDCHIECSPANCIAMAAEIRRFQPHAVLAPRPDENQHPDHAAVGKLVRDAARLARYGGLEEIRGLPVHAIASLYYYAVTEIFTPAPDLVLDVSGVRETWVEAMRCHQSQMATRGYVELVEARARALGAAIGVEWAVGLWVNDPVRIESLDALPLSSRYF